MAKKSTPSAKKTRAAKPATTPSTSDKKEVKRAFDPDLIGRTAGTIWQLLDEKGPMSVTAIKKQCDTTSDVVLAGVGWLAREDKLRFVHSGRTTKIELT